MTVTLRVVLDQLVAPTDPDLEAASASLARGLVATAPEGCDVAAIVPAGPVDVDVDGLAEVRRVAMGRRELAAAWQLGVVTGTGSGLVHSPTLMAPLVRHDRANDNHQVVVTLWDLQPWEHPSEVPASTRAWSKAMLKRARKHADAVIVPTHAMARALEERVHLGGRIRVMAGAAPTGFAVPSDASGRRHVLGLPETVVTLVGDAAPSAALSSGFAALVVAGIDQPVAVLDAGPDDEAAVKAIARDAGVDPERVHVFSGLRPADRAAVLDASAVLIAPGRRRRFPWRVMEAMALHVPVVAAASDDHRDVIVDGGLVVGDDGDAGDDVWALGEAAGRALRDDELLDRLSVLAGDRSRSFSWRAAAERVWQLHADL